MKQVQALNDFTLLQLPRQNQENVRTKEGDEPILMTKRFSSQKAEKDPFVAEEAE